MLPATGRWRSPCSMPRPRGRRRHQCLTGTTKRGQGPAPVMSSPARVDRARFYTIGGQHWPSVTTILIIIAKPALGPWYAKEERRYFEAAMLEVLRTRGAADRRSVLTAVAEAVSGVKAADRAKQQAATIGTAMHAGIEWALRTQLGEAAGPEPRLPDAAAWARGGWEN